jgi:hypothetical protein
MKIRIDFSNMIGEAVGGIPEAEWQQQATKFADAYAGFDKLRSGGSVGFVDIVTDDELRDQAIQFAERARGRYDDVVILGIGGRSPSERLEHAFG